ncbi:hypothetical protein BT96DRAFT_1017059 [Gymnopus androsaceus JB14]|uniref:Uncharacterized protein n=1 Tax=Gymnopus androsaceus JB14 TaxID=1447944 RepID=A0A6A4HZ90_9AGAR|nr:hypothetical protein BT96DRAFT_1017059 [Gymnopus androsaceus JB14]
MYLRLIVCLLAFSSKGSTAANQHPLPTVFQSVSNDWDLNKPFTANTTVNLVFATASSLLQAAPNLRYRNGHTIVPGIVRPGTLLYHGREDSIIPATDWVAFDPEISYDFCRVFTLSGGGCWHLTFAAARPLRVLYFDGASAAKLGGGEMDSQDIITWGEIRPDRVLEEGLRIQNLCEWGKPLGLDGFVRIGCISEIMLCNFSSVNLVSSQHLKSAPSKAFPPPVVVPLKPIPINSEGIIDLRVLDRFSQYPGVMHARLDLSRLVSFYDEKLAPSLVAVRSDRPRLEHRLLGITEEDLVRAKKYLEEQVMETRWSSLEGVGNHLDWPTHLHSIVELYGETFEDIWNLVNSTASLAARPATQRVKNVFQLVESLVPTIRLVQRLSSFRLR